MEKLKTVFTPRQMGEKSARDRAISKEYHIMINASLTERDHAILKAFIRSYLDCDALDQEIEDE